MKTNVEVNGYTVKNVIDGMGVFQRRGRELLATSGISEVNDEQWYSLDALLAVIEELGSSTCSQIGRAVPNNSLFPPEIDTFEKALSTVDMAYHMNHRNGEIGNYKVTQVSDKEYQVTCNTPYPQAFNLGLIRGLASKFNCLIRVEELDKSGGGVFKVVTI